MGRGFLKIIKMGCKKRRTKLGRVKSTTKGPRRAATVKTTKK